MGALLGPIPAAAVEPHPRTSSLSWVRLAGAESCVATQDLARRVEARLGRSVFVSAAQADVSVEGHIEKTGGGYRAVLTLRDDHGVALGVRELSRPGASCDPMREPLALIIAVMIDPDAALTPERPPQPPPPPELPTAVESPPPPPVVVVRPPEVAGPVVAPAPKPSWSLDVGGALATNLGLLPLPSLGLYGGGLLEPPRLFPLEAFGIVWLDDTARSGSTAVTFSLIEGGAGLCPLHYDGARLRAYGCAAGELGLLTARSTGLATQRGPFVAGALEGRVTIRLAGPFAARAGVSAVLPFTRTDSRATTGATTTDVFRASLVGATADFGLGVEFP